MKKVVIVSLYSLIISLSVLIAQPVKIAVVSDIHYLSKTLADEGKALSKYELSIGRDVIVMHEILDKVIKDIIEEKPDILLITGDITNHGEKQSHIDIIKKLKALKDNGTRILVVPGNHDINVPNSKAFIGDSATPTPNISEKEFQQLYWEYGYSEALKKDDNSLGYLAEINENTWLIAFDTNLHREYMNNSISGGRISTATLEWALNILKEAKSKDITVFGMMHHGLVEHMPYQATFFSDYIIDDWQNIASLLSDAGLKVMFTGHFHANDITLYTTSSGCKTYDIGTGSLAQYPFPYRIINLEHNALHIDTKKVESIKSDANLANNYKNKFEQISRSAITSKLKRINIPLSDEAHETVVKLLTRISLLHVSGDEYIDKDTYKIIKQFADVMGNESFDINTFSLDYPPADNKLTIELK